MIMVTSWMRVRISKIWSSLPLQYGPEISMLTLFILLSLWLWRPPEKPNWPEAGSHISPLALITEHPARSKGCVEIRAMHYRSSSKRGFDNEYPARADKEAFMTDIYEITITTQDGEE